MRLEGPRIDRFVREGWPEKGVNRFPFVSCLWCRFEVSGYLSPGIVVRLSFGAVSTSFRLACKGRVAWSRSIKDWSRSCSVKVQGFQVSLAVSFFLI